MAAIVANFHFEGADQGGVLTDTSGKTWTKTGSPVTQTQETWVGVSSGYFPGTGYLTHASHEDFQFGTGAFTIRGLVRCLDSSATVRHIFGNSFAAGGNGGYYLYWQQGVLVFGYQTPDLVYHEVKSLSLGALSIYNRYYIEITREDGVLSMRVNDVVTATLDDVSGHMIGRDAPVYLGYSTSAYGSPFYGYMDEIQVIKGAALHVTFAQALAGLPDALSSPAVYGEVELPISVIAAAMGQVALPISVRVGQLGTVALAVDVQVVPAAILSGTESVCVRIGEAAVWVPVVRLDGVDITAQTLGEIRIEAEEGAARIAELTIRPGTGTTLYLPEWTGRALTVDVADNRTGTPRWPMRLFTGVVDTPSLDLNSRTLALSATDDLQGVCDGMTQAALAALIGGYYSPVVFDAAALGWDYANDRMSTIPAALDISPLGVLRVTPWAAKEIADLVLDGLIGDGSLAVDLAPRASLTNEVNINFGYRFPRVKAEAHSLNYTAVDMTGFAQYILDEQYLPQRAAIEAAISKAGGTIADITYTPLPDEIIAVGSGYWSPGPNDDELCLGFAATVTFDYAATIEEQHEIRVSAQKSIDAVGVRRASMSGALEGEYPDLVATETALKLFKDAVTSIPPADAATPVPEKTTSAEVTLTPETNRAAANAAMETLIAIAKARIWASHRGNSVTVTVPLLPALDVDKTVAFSDSGVTVKGKVRRVVHVLDTDSGIATSEVTVALCSVAGVGIVHDEDATTAPDGTSASESDIDTAPVVEFLNGPAEDHSITVTFPAVDEAERNGSAVVLPASYAAPLVEDLFTVTI